MKEKVNIEIDDGSVIPLEIESSENLQEYITKEIGENDIIRYNGKLYFVKAIDYARKRIVALEIKDGKIEDDEFEDAPIYKLIEGDEFDKVELVQIFIPRFSMFLQVFLDPEKIYRHKEKDLRIGIKVLGIKGSITGYIGRIIGKDKDKDLINPWCVNFVLGGEKLLFLDNNGRINFLKGIRWVGEDEVIEIPEGKTWQEALVEKFREDAKKQEGFVSSKTRKSYDDMETILINKMRSLQKQGYSAKIIGVKIFHFLYGRSEITDPSYLIDGYPDISKDEKIIGKISVKFAKFIKNLAEGKISEEELSKFLKNRKDI